MNFQQQFIVDDIISFSREDKYQDLTIICQNGTFQSNSLVLAAMFPVMKSLLSSGHQEDASAQSHALPQERDCSERDHPIQEVHGRRRQARSGKKIFQLGTISLLFHKTLISAFVMKLFPNSFVVSTREKLLLL